MSSTESSTKNHEKLFITNLIHIIFLLSLAEIINSGDHSREKAYPFLMFPA